MLCSKELLRTEEYKIIMQHDIGDPNPISELLNASDALLCAASNFYKTIAAMVSETKITMSKDARQCLLEIGEQPLCYLRGCSPQTDIYGNAVPEWWENKYLDELLTNTAEGLAKIFNESREFNPGTITPEYFGHANKVWRAYAELLLRLVQLYNHLNRISRANVILAQHKREDEIKYMRSIISRLLSRRTGHTGRPLSECLACNDCG